MQEHSSMENITTRKVNRCGIVTLDRPNALNALTQDMIEGMEAFYLDCLKDPHIYGIVIESGNDRAFCAGADVRSLVENLPTQSEEAKAALLTEYQHNWTLEQFNKPHVALINGVVMGGGVGISQYGTHRVMGEKALFAMPEVNIGLFPDIGASYFLSRLEGGMGLYLGLTGRTLKPEDCYYLGLATHTISSQHFDTIKEAMIESDPIDPVLEGLQEDFGVSELSGLQDTVDRVFQGDRLEDVFTNLEKEGEDGWSDYSDWARDLEDVLREKCPQSLKITFKMIKDAARYTSLKEALIVDARVGARLIEDANFQEGVRAVLIDKTKDAKWTHASVEDVSDEEVARFFAPLNEEPKLQDAPV